MEVTPYPTGKLQPFSFLSPPLLPVAYSSIRLLQPWFSLKKVAINGRHCMSHPSAPSSCLCVAARFPRKHALMGPFPAGAWLYTSTLSSLPPHLAIFLRAHSLEPCRVRGLLVDSSRARAKRNSPNESTEGLTLLQVGLGQRVLRR